VQVTARRQAYADAWPDSLDHVVLLGGVPVGRLLVDRGDTTVHVIDVRLEPDERRSGVGTAVMAQVCDDATLAGLPVTLSVRAGTPTEAWYRRLGFVDASAPDPNAADVDLVRTPDR
jgi:GNAT superfamily N-acetyltransferase